MFLTFVSVVFLRVPIPTRLYKAHVGRIYPYNAPHTREKYKRSLVQVSLAPPFEKALFVECLFCWLIFPTTDGEIARFLSMQVIECFWGRIKKASFGPFSLTAKSAGSTHGVFLTQELLKITFPFFNLSIIYPSLKIPF